VQFADLVMKLKKYRGKHKKDILRYAFLLGLSLQLVNDVNDFVPSAYEKRTLAKDASDCFSDIKNKNVTLPILIHLLSINQGLDLGKLDKFLEDQSILAEFDPEIKIEKRVEILELLKNEYLVASEEEEAVLFDIAPVLIKYIMPIAQKWADDGEACLRTEKIQGRLLTELLEVAYDNQYYRYILSKCAKQL